MKKGLLIVVSGPAGSGKGTVAKRLIKTGTVVYSVSATTRAPRPGEVEGESYYYITRESFMERIKSGDMIEHTEYCGNFYGTPKKETLAMLESGKNVILELEVEGAMNIKAQYPEAVLILFLPPSFAVQEQRLRKRGTETEEKICARLERTKEELKRANAYDYVVYNHDFRDAEAAQKILNIIDAELSSIKRNPDVEVNYFDN
jgi:guanylate kinase